MLSSGVSRPRSYRFHGTGIEFIWRFYWTEHFHHVCRFSGLIGALGGGYNGLPSMVGLDESLSDVAVRKKYPFELEKAIHNVKFIQHHTQRQDEFDA
ncbi:unnamed protein product, partial [Nesidiocoris tenuis]